MNKEYSVYWENISGSTKVQWGVLKSKGANAMCMLGCVDAKLCARQKAKAVPCACQYANASYGQQKTM